jgi:hypothetical protein
VKTRSAYSGRLTAHGASGIDDVDSDLGSVASSEALCLVGGYSSSGSCGKVMLSA